jgi:hypothetical protein
VKPAHNALHEATKIDRRRTGCYNTELVEYLIPVIADIDTAQIIGPEEGG